ncbi:VCBS domain-containing protein [Pseudodesulfovibrio sp. zrk46]|uniref:VCBS domain-containing protein n=1 Tax=Pseudodesulfovibrio sp. zrk46 TaxID=2725288 RepID=UPI001448AE29|nr:VCBS domain-containing protein [Pseudodesulfovibrio sp. zrk46]QJB57170.1 tandem-95 repeat protein [Pseudodesulfovibrio sp. zrk46]
MADQITVTKPAIDGVTTIPVAADAALIFDFDISTAEFNGNGPDLVITLEEGGVVIVKDYLIMAEEGTLPTFELMDGTEVPGDVYLFAFNEESSDQQDNFDTAADSAASGSGVGSYVDDSGNLFRGVDSLGNQGDPEFESSSFARRGGFGASDTTEAPNTAPIINGTLSLSLNEDNDPQVAGDPYIINDTDILALVTDTPGSFLSVTQLNVSGGTLTNIGPGQWSYVPDQDYFGTIDVTFTVTDAGGLSSSGTGTITVVPVNDAPEAEDDTNAVTEDAIINGTVAGNDSDVDNTAEELSYSLADDQAPVKGFTLNADGSYTFDASEYDDLTDGEKQTITIKYQVSDGDLIDTAELTITVTGTNDTAVISVGGTDSDTGAVTELAEGIADQAVTLTDSGKLSISDADDGEDVFSTTVDNTGKVGALSITTDGNWTYNVDNTATEVQQLGAGETLTETFVVTSDDGSASHTVTVTINGTEDTPVITGTASGDVTEETDISVSGALDVTDVDLVDTPDFDAGTVQGNYGAVTIDADGNWTYTLDSRADALNAGDSASDSIVVYARTDDGEVVSQTISIDITGTNDTAVISVGDTDSDTGSVTELAEGVADQAVTLTDSGKLSISDADDGEDVFSTTVDNTGKVGALSITTDGNWTYNVDNTATEVQQLGAGETLTETFVVTSDDGSASHTVTVTINGTEDTPVITGTASGDVTEETDISVSGALDVTDVDLVDTPDFDAGTVQGNYGAVTIDADGNWTYTLDSRADALNAGDSASDSIVVYARTDDGEVVSQTISIDITGTNDTAVISVGDTDSDTGAVTELAEGIADQDVTLTSTGKLSISDADDGEDVFSTTVDNTGKVGALSITTDGNWTYNVDNTATEVQQLGAGETLTETFVVTSDDGSASHTVTVTINGTEDTPVITGTASGDVTEETDISVSGALDVTDVDLVDTPDFDAGTVQGNYGAVTIDADGNWTYTLDSRADALNAGDSASDSIVVYARTDDGEVVSQTISIDITGTNDTAVISVGDTDSDTGAVTELAEGIADQDVTLTSTGKLSISDADDGEDVFSTTVDNTGKVGALSITADGNWTYNVDNTATEVQQLGAGETLTETFVVTSDDGSASHTVTVTINGTEDTPVITGTASGAVTEETDISVSGALDVTDVDLVDTPDFDAGTVQGNYGAVTIDADGNWTYTLDSRADALNAGDSASDSIVVYARTDDGEVVSQTISIDITGTNDTAVISVGDTDSDTGAVTELAEGIADQDVTLTSTGKLSISDADDGEDVFSTTVDNTGKVGALSITTDGNWTYNVDNTATEVQQLGAGETLTETFVVTSDDGSASHTVTVTINGTEDTPVITGTASGDVTEETDISVSGALDVTDVDLVDTPDFDAGTVQGNYGSVTIDADGNWTYTLDSRADALNAGDSASDSIVVYARTDDGEVVSQTISIDITGTNDTAVISVGGTDSDTGSVTELAEGVADQAVTLTDSGKLSISDADDGEDVFSTTVDNTGKVGALSITADGNWTYNVDNTATEVQQLGAGDTLTETFVVTSADGSASHTVTVTINGTEDTPVITGTASGDVTEETDISVSGALDVTDVDLVDTPDFDAGTVQGNYGSVTIDADGNWTYTLDSRADALNAGDSASDSIVVYARTDDGEVVSQTISIDITGTNDTAVISVGGTDSDTGSVTELAEGVADQAVTLTDSGKLSISDADDGEDVFSTTVDNTGKVGALSITADGNWTYNVDNTATEVQQLGAGETLTEIFVVTSADGSASHTVTVTINGTEDTPVITGTASGDVTEETDISVSGALDVTDVDLVDTPDFDAGTVQGNYGSVTIDADGNWTYTLDSRADALNAGDSASDSIVVYARTDDGEVVSQTISIDITGTNDTAVISVGGTDSDTGAVTELAEGVADQAVTLTDSGKLSISDADDGEDVFSTTVDNTGKVGALSITADGNWTYNVDNTATEVQQLGAGDTLTETFVVTSADGSASHTVTVTINGTEDTPVITGTASGDVTEETDISVSGALDVTDVDLVDTPDFDAGTVQGNYGSVTIDADGNWTYTLDSRADALNAGDSASDSIVVYARTDDGEVVSQTISIDITGTNDTAVISVGGTDSDTGSVTELAEGVADQAVTLTDSGKLSISDADDGEDVFSTTVDNTGKVGALSITADGNWTYNVDNTATEVQQLGAGDTLTETFVVTSADGSASHTVTVTINGTEDTPVITGTASGDVTEETDISVSGALDVTDVDLVDTPDFDAGTVQGNYGSVTIDADGNWTYTLDSRADALNAGDSASDSIVVYARTDDGEVVSQTISIDITGTNDTAVISVGGTDSDTGSVTELAEGIADQAVTLTDSGKLSISDADDGEDVFSTTVDNTGKVGALSITADGNWTYNVDNTATEVQQLGAGETLTEIFVVTSADGSASHTVTVTINGTEDTPVITGTASGDVTEETDISVSGALDVTDVDLVDTPDFDAGTVQGNYGSVTIDADGNWTYTLDSRADALNAGDSASDSIVVYARTDDGEVVSQTISIDITGTNDTAVITTRPGGDTGSVSERPENAANQDVTLTTKGKLSIEDADEGEDEFSTTVDNTGKVGSLTITADGKWTYEVDNNDSRVQELEAGETLTETFVVESADGSASHTVTVTINGTEDTPVISGDASGSVVEATDISVSGALDVNDLDAEESLGFDAGTVQGNYGSVEIDADGNWTYTLDSRADVLNAGDDATDSITVYARTDDGEVVSQTISIDITGTNDDAEISVPADGADTGSVNEDDFETTLTTSGKLDIADADDGEANFSTSVDQGDNLGSLTIDADGNWDYSVNNNLDAVQQLGVGDTLTETFVVSSQDGTASHTVTVTINGTNDAPTIDLDGGSHLEVNFVRETAGYNNLFGVYKIAADGTASEPQVLINNQNAGIPGGHTLGTLEPGESYGYFIIANGSGQYGDVSDDQLSFGMGADGKMVLMIDGQPSSHPVYFSQDEHNPDSLDGSDPNHTDKNGVSAPGHFIIEDPDADGSYIVRMEDLPNGGDHDYVDIVVRITPVEGSEGTGFEGTYIENAGSVYIASAALDISDVDSATMTDATITLTNTLDGDELQLGTLPDGIVATTSTDDQGNIVITLTAADGTTAPVADFEAAIKSIAFFNTSDDPDTADRTVTVTVSDDYGASSNTAVSTIHVEARNDAPLIRNDAVSTDEDNSVTIDFATLLANDSDVDSDTLTITRVLNPQNGTVTIDHDAQTITFTPDPDYNGPASFTYGVSDGDGAYREGRVDVTVNPVNEPPTSVDFAVAGDDMGEAVTIDFLRDVGATDPDGVNVDDVDGTVTQIKITSLPEGGTLYYTPAEGGDPVEVTDETTYDADGTFTFEPEELDSSTLMLGTKDGSHLGLDNWGSNTDGDATTLTQTVNGSTVTISSGTGTLSGNATDGYQITAGGAGRPLYQYNENTPSHMGFGIGDNDGNGIEAGETITVDFGDSVVSTAKVGFDGLGGHFDDGGSVGAKAVWIAMLDGQVVGSGAVVNDNTDGSLFEELVITSDMIDGGLFDSIVFTTDSPTNSNWELRYVESEFGADSSFTYKPVDNDGLEGNESVVSIDVTPENLTHEPPVSQSFSEDVNPGETVAVDFTDGALSDLEDGTVDTVVIKSLPTEGKLVDDQGNEINVGDEVNINNVNYEAPDTVDGPAVTGVFLGARDAGDEDLANWGTEIDANTRQMAVTDDITVTVTSEGGSLTQFHAENPSHMGTGIGVGGGEGINDGETISIDFDGALVSVAEVSFDGLGGHFEEGGSVGASATWVAYNGDTVVASGEVYAPDSGLESVVTIGQDILQGQLFDRIEFSTDSTAASNWELKYVDVEFGSGTSFDYAPIDSDNMEGNTSTVSLTFDAPDSLTDEAPIAADDTFNTNEDEALTISYADLLANDVELDGEDLTLDSVQDAQGGTVEIVDGQVVFTPDAEFSGTASFTYTISDEGGTQSTATATVEVAEVNDAPVAVDDEFGSVTVNPGLDIDVDTPMGVAPQAVADSWKESGVTVEAYKGDALNMNNWTSESDIVISGKTVNADYDPENEYAGLGISNPSEEIDAGEIDGLRAFNGSGNNNHTEVMSVSFAQGMESVTLELAALFDGNRYDAGNMESARIAVYGEATSPNGKPVLLGYVDVDADDNGQVTVYGPKTQGQYPAIGTATVTQGEHDGLVNVTLDSDTFGDEIIQLGLMPLDNGVGSSGNNSDFLLKSVSATSEGSIDATYLEGETITLNASDLLTNDTDAEGATLTIASVSDVVDEDGNVIGHGNVTLNADGTITFEPEGDFSGKASFTYTVTDGDKESEPATVTLNITPVNDAPVLDLADGQVVTVDSQDAGYTNMLGIYFVENGVPTEPEIILANSHDANMLKNVLETFDGDEDVHFFVISDAGDKGISASDVQQDGLVFAKDDGEWALSIPQADGSAEYVDVQFDIAAFNPNGEEATFRFETAADGSMSVMIDDQISTGDDDDFNDLVASVDAAADNDTGYATTWVETEDAVSIAGDVTITDVDSANMSSATIVLTNAQDGDVLNTDNLPDGITAETVVANGQITVTLTGAADLAVYMAAIKAVTFENGNVTPNTTDRVVQVTVFDDEGAASNTATSTIAVVDDPTTVPYVPEPEYNGNDGMTVPDDFDSHPTNGDDVLVGHNYGDVILGSNGNDVIYGLGHGDNLHGENGNDTIYGGDGGDVITGSNGQDVLHGGDGSDVLTGGNDNDLIYGGRDNDLMAGDNGMDTLAGGEGNDKLYGGHDSDLLHGGSGDDTLYGDFENSHKGGGSDTLIGGDGDDHLYGGRGNNLLVGGEGDDFLTGGEHNDIFVTGDGDDTIETGRGNDTVFIDQSVLGHGSDIVVTDFNAGHDVLELGDGVSVKDITSGTENHVEYTEVLVGDEQGNDVVVKLLGVSQTDLSDHNSSVDSTNTAADDLIQYMIDSGNES